MSDNPRAYPCGDQRGTEPDYGMTLRDWLAGQALQGTATQEHDSGLSDVKPGRPNHPELAAKAAYRFADAMLEARKAKP